MVHGAQTWWSINRLEHYQVMEEVISLHVFGLMRPHGKQRKQKYSEITKLLHRLEVVKITLKVILIPLKLQVSFK